MILHTKTTREVGIHEAKVEQTASWWESELLDKKEKMALAYCDALTEGTHQDFQRYHGALASRFSEVEIAEIAAIIINVNVWTRLKLAQGAKPYFE